MGKLYEEIERFSTKIKHMYERDTNVQEISDTFRNALSQSMDKYMYVCRPTSYAFVKSHGNLSRFLLRLACCYNVFCF
jgi:hypothetical protein